jgi:hypothetical protein
VYLDEVNQAKNSGMKDLERVNALSIASGYMGGTEAVRAETASTEKTDTKVTEIRNRMAKDLSTIYSNIQSLASTEQQNQISNARADRSENRTIDTENRKQLTDQIELLAKSGAVDYEAFKTNQANASIYNTALEAYGGSEDILKGVFALNRPQNTILDTKWDGSKMFQVYRHPVTGKITTEMTDLGSAGYNPPRGYTKSIDLGNRIMMVPEDFDPEKDTPYYIPKGLTPNQIDENNRKDKETSDYDTARQFIGDNSTGEWFQLRSALLENTKLNATEVDSLLQAEGVKPPKNEDTTSFADLLD